MANLAQTQQPIGARRRGSDNRDFTLPSRRNTDAPNLEVNAPISSPNASRAQALMDILGVAQQAGDQVVKYLGAKEDAKNAKSAAAGSLAEETGQVDQRQLAKNRYYAAAYHEAGAARAGIELSGRVTQAINERLADEDNPATPDDINEIINQQFASVALNEDGTPRDFGIGNGRTILAKQMMSIRAELLPKALAAIKAQTDTKLLNNWAFVAAEEAASGTALGIAAPSAIQQIDPGASTIAQDPTDPPPAEPTMSLMVPFHGFSPGNVSSRLGAPRSGGRRHNGEDFPVADGTPIVASMSGTVLPPNDNKLGGTQVRIKLDNGVVLGFAHLSSRAVQAGARVSAGTVLGMSGHSGDSHGSHVHMTVTLPDGKKVSPSEYFGKNPQVTSSATEDRSGTGPVDPNLRPVVPTTIAPTPVDVEAYMARIPPGVSKGTAKDVLIQAMEAKAAELNRPDLLAGLLLSKRKDGTPSFDPGDVLKIQEAQRELETRGREDAKRKERERWDANADVLIRASIDGKEPSDATLRAWADRGDVDPQFAYGMIKAHEQEREQAAREATQEAREQAREDAAEADADVASEAVLISSGVIKGHSIEEITRRFNNGELGEGKAAIRHYNTLRGALKQGQETIQRSPENARWAAQVDTDFAVAKSGRKAGASLLTPMAVGVSKAVHDGAMARFRQLTLEEGMEPHQAYLQVKKEWGSSGSGTTTPAAPLTAAQRKRQAELRAKAAH